MLTKINKYISIFLAIILLIPISAYVANQKAPDFNVKDETGKIRSIQQFDGKKILLFFYAKDNAGSPEPELMILRDNYKIFEKNKINILGINYESVESHKNLKEKLNLPFSLLSDEKMDIAKAYEAKRHPIFNILTVFRAPKSKTFIIDNNQIQHVIDGVSRTYILEIIKAFNIKE